MTRDPARMQAACDWLAADPARTPTEACREFGVEINALRRARQLRAERGVCPHCGQIMPAKPTGKASGKASGKPTGKPTAKAADKPPAACHLLRAISPSGASLLFWRLPDASSALADRPPVAGAAPLNDQRAARALLPAGYRLQGIDSWGAWVTLAG